MVKFSLHISADQAYELYWVKGIAETAILYYPNKNLWRLLLETPNTVHSRYLDLAYLE